MTHILPSLCIQVLTFLGLGAARQVGQMCECLSPSQTQTPHIVKPTLKQQGKPLTLLENAGFIPTSNREQMSLEIITLPAKQKALKCSLTKM